MKKPSYLYTALFSAVLSFAFCLPAQAEEANPWEGMYEVIDAPKPPEDKSQIEATEFFLYTCPHCFHFENYTQPWEKSAKADYVKFKRMPAVFNQRNTLLAKAFYTAEALGILEKVHMPLFKAIQEERRPMNKESDISELFVKFGGVTAEEFSKTFNSFSVDNLVRRANSLTVGYGIMAVPTIVVDGTYRLTPDKTQGFENQLKIVDYLALQEMKTRNPEALMKKAEPAAETEASAEAAPAEAVAEEAPAAEK